jgi:hypothetical protein
MPKDALKEEETTALVYELQEETFLAICELRGDCLRICMSAPGGSRRPTRFASEVGSENYLVTLTRAKPITAEAMGVGLLGLGGGVAAGRYLSRKVLPTSRWSRYYWVLYGAAGIALSALIIVFV